MGFHFCERVLRDKLYRSLYLEVLSLTLMVPTFGFVDSENRVVEFQKMRNVYMY